MTILGKTQGYWARIPTLHSTLHTPRACTLSLPSKFYGNFHRFAIQILWRFSQCGSVVQKTFKLAIACVISMEKGEPLHIQRVLTRVEALNPLGMLSSNLLNKQKLVHCPLHKSCTVSLAVPVTGFHAGLAKTFSPQKFVP